MHQLESSTPHCRFWQGALASVASSHRSGSGSREAGQGGQTLLSKARVARGLEEKGVTAAHVVQGLREAAPGHNMRHTAKGSRRWRSVTMVPGDWVQAAAAAGAEGARTVPQLDPPAAAETPPVDEFWQQVDDVAFKHDVVTPSLAKLRSNPTSLHCLGDVNFGQFEVILGNWVVRD
jgi:hypothetical protein